MSKEDKYTGFAIALAWPETYCKQPGSWYDPITFMLGVNNNNYYKVGHAALILIDSKNLKAHYFDFGRYHAPYQHGRVRSAESDHELELKTIPRLSGNGKEIDNYKDLLNELQSNPASHGEGEMHAAYCPVNFENAYSKVIDLQKLSPIPYGPFRINGTNCSRFVNTAILAGKPQLKYRFNLKYRVPLTPTPISNINALNHQVKLPKLLEGELFCPTRKLDKQLLTATLPQPEKHRGIPEDAQWLSGEGAGSWFAFAVEKTLLKVSRYSPKGVLECTGLYENQDAQEILRNAQSFAVVYPSNCRVVSLNVNDSQIRFHRA